MKQKMQDCGSGSAIYGLGFIGAAVYFISSATSFLDRCIRSFKSHSLACFYRL